RSGGRRGRRRGRRLSVFAEDDQGGAHLDNLSLLRPELEDLARDRRWDLHRDLVRHHFDDRVILPDGVAFLHEPLDDLALVDPFPDVRELELARHRPSFRPPLPSFIVGLAFLLPFPAQGFPLLLNGLLFFGIAIVLGAASLGLMQMRAWGWGLAILASLVTLVYVGYNAFLRPDASLTL